MPTFLHAQRELLWLSMPRRAIHDRPTAGLREWLLDKGSLTAKLVQLSHGDFQVKVMRQLRMRANPSEAFALGIKPYHLCLLREVVLLGQNQPWVFARSLLPLSSLTGKLRHLRKQGKRPLGAFLFSQPQLRRSAIALSLISRHHAYVPAELFTPASQDVSLWGRRSVFYVSGKPLLVSEVFLPDFPASTI